MCGTIAAVKIILLIRALWFLRCIFLMQSVVGTTKTAPAARYFVPIEYIACVGVSKWVEKSVCTLMSVVHMPRTWNSIEYQINIICYAIRTYRIYYIYIDTLIVYGSRTQTHISCVYAIKWRSCFSNSNVCNLTMINSNGNGAFGILDMLCCLRNSSLHHHYDDIDH